jgi:hemoglobin
MRQSALTLILVLFVACAGKGGTKPTPTGSLYDRLGGKDAIAAVVDRFVENLRADARVKEKFANSDLPTFKGRLVDQICEASGGPCKYLGKNMKEAHLGMGLTVADFNATVEDLVKALDALKVPQREKDELIALLAPMKDDIVEVK